MEEAIRCWSEHASHGESAFLTVLADHSSRFADGLEHPAAAADGVADPGGHGIRPDLEDGRAAASGPLNHPGEIRYRRRDWRWGRGDGCLWMRQLPDREAQGFKALHPLWFRWWRSGGYRVACGGLRCCWLY